MKSAHYNMHKSIADFKYLPNLRMQRWAVHFYFCHSINAYRAAAVRQKTRALENFRALHCLLDVQTEQ